MKRKILTYSDSNMAGFSWRWDFYLEGEAGSTYKLSCKQIIYDDEDDEDNEPLTIEPVSGLRRGADVYEALTSMVSEAGYSLHESELPEIAAKIARLPHPRSIVHRSGRGRVLPALEQRAAYCVSFNR